MQQSMITTVIRNLSMQVPLLVALLVTMVLALVFWRRHPSASLGAFLGALLLFMTAMIQPFVTAAVLQGPRPSGLAPAAMLTAVTVIANIFRGAGIGLLTWAVFTGRRGTSAGGFPVSTPPPLPGRAGPRAIPPHGP